jgi:hypothetical protein
VFLPPICQAWALEKRYKNADLGILGVGQPSVDPISLISMCLIHHTTIAQAFRFAKSGHHKSLWGLHN